MEVRASLDLQLSPLGLRAMATLDLKAGERVLDVGCGTGQTLLQLADVVGSDGAVVGIDISAPLLAVAAERTSFCKTVSLIEGDAQTTALGAGAFDAVFSRFGVTGFADPVAAFANLRTALKPGGRQAFVCWRSLGENELDALPLHAAGLMEAVDQAPFAFEDRPRIVEVLSAAGFRNIAVEPHDQYVGSGSLDAMLSVVTRVGALGKMLRENPALIADAEPPVRAALAAREGRDGVVLKAATWVVTAIG